MKTKNVAIASFVPLYDRVVVERLEEDDMVGSIYLADVAKEKPQKGMVIAKGVGRYEKGNIIPLMVQEGDMVLFSKYAGSETRIDDRDVIILKEDEILGVWRY